MDVTSVDHLFEKLNNKDVVLLDVTINSTTEVESSNLKLITIKGALLFDLKNKFRNLSSNFPNTIPSEEQFELEARKLGISKSSEIVVFDNRGIYYSARAWWLFKVMGHQNVSVLNGGLPAWISRGYETCAKYRIANKLGDFEAKLQEQFLINYKDVLNNTVKEQFTLVDARSAGRFAGVEPEPRKYLKSGHVPNSINLPYEDLLLDGKFKSKQELIKIFEEKRMENETLVFSCGSGVTACIVMLASHIAGYSSKKLYDGSWSEWAELQDLVQE